MIIFFILFGILLVLLFFGALFGAPWFITKKKDYDRIAKLANLKRGTIFYDLGCGTGNMLFYLSKKYKINCIGIEVSPVLFLYSKIKSLFRGRVKIKYGNFFNYNLSKADVVYVFLMPNVYNKLKNKLNRELKNEVKVILAYWPFKKSKPIFVSKKEGDTTYYLYKKPL